MSSFGHTKTHVYAFIFTVTTITHVAALETPKWQAGGYLAL